MGYILYRKRLLAGTLTAKSMVSVDTVKLGVANAMVLNMVSIKKV